MPDRLVETDLNWRDGVLVDLQFAGFGGEQREVRPIVDLYRDSDSGSDLTRFLVKGGLAKLTRNAKSGNIDWMRTDFAATTETVILLLFGGYLEAEAATFTLTEMNS